MTKVDPGRTAQEVALMADRLDVSEELVRLKYVSLSNGKVSYHLS